MIRFGNISRKSLSLTSSMSSSSAAALPTAAAGGGAGGAGAPAAAAAGDELSNLADSAVSPGQVRVSPACGSLSGAPPSRKISASSRRTSTQNSETAAIAPNPTLKTTPTPKKRSSSIPPDLPDSPHGNASSEDRRPSIITHQLTAARV